MRKSLAVLTLACASGYANAGPAELAGVWTGTLGKTPITACFNADPDSNGSYYYQRYLTPIQLIEPEADAPWMEADKTGFWQLDTPQGEALSGIWSKTVGGTPLPLTLTRISSEGCGSDAYNAPLEAKLPVKTEKLTFGEHTYQVKTQGAQVTLELQGDGLAIQKVNQQLAQLAASPKSEFFDERRERLGSFGSNETSEISVEPVYWSSQWITVKFYRWSAGYGARGISWGLHTWNLQTGESVDPWTWLGTSYEWYDRYSGNVKLPQKLATWLRTQSPADTDCPDVASYESYDLSFDLKGMNLANHPSGDGCDVDVSASWQQLQPLLSAQGQAALPSLQTP